jgi:acyl-CoA thioesterase-1
MTAGNQNMERRLASTTCLLLTVVLVWPVSALHAQQAKAKRQTKKPHPALEIIKDDPSLPRVLLIGDSISIGYTLPTRKALAGKANVHRLPENCGSTQKGILSIDDWLGSGTWDVIHFNWGLHDVKYIEGRFPTPIEQYEANLRQLVERLKKTNARLIWCSTTPVPNAELSPPRKNKDVLAYNAVALDVMRERGVAINDLYGFALPRLTKIQRPRNVHFLPEGYDRLADQVATSILAALKEPAK